MPPDHLKNDQADDDDNLSEYDAENDSHLDLNAICWLYRKKHRMKNRS